MFYEQLPDFVRKLYKDAIWRKDSNKKTVYLTFDDGPIPEVTPWVLDVLDKYNIKASFFCVGDNVRKHPDVFNEIKKRGHSVGNHTFNHIRGLLFSNDEYIINIEKANNYINSDLFRPPYGEMKWLQYRYIRNKYRIIQWDVVSRDYNSKLSGEDVLGIVKKRARNGSVIVFHDSLKAEKNMKYAMPKAIEYLLKEGYSFDKL